MKTLILLALLFISSNLYSQMQIQSFPTSDSTGAILTFNNQSLFRPENNLTFDNLLSGDSIGVYNVSYTGDTTLQTVLRYDLNTEVQTIAMTSTAAVECNIKNKQMKLILVKLLHFAASSKWSTRATKIRVIWSPRFLNF